VVTERAKPANIFQSCVVGKHSQISQQKMLKTFGRSARGIRLVRSFSTVETNGIKIASIDDGRPVSQLSLVVKAGSRYEPSSVPGVAHILEKFAYKNTTPKSGLRLVRETELLGGQLESSLTREHLVLTTKFLREDLPYFVQALADVAQSTIYNKYELDEEAAPLAKLEYQLAHEDAMYTAVEAVHGVAFHSGLGNSLLAHPASPVSIQDVINYTREAYTKANITLVAKGVHQGDLVSLVDSKWAALPSGEPLKSAQSTFHSGEARIRAAGDNVVVIAFPLAANAPSAVLAQHLGTAKHSIKWSLGGSTPLGIVGRKTNTTIAATNAAYSDASLLYITISGANAVDVRNGALEAANVVKEIAASGLTSEQLNRAIAKARFAAVEAQESVVVGAATHDVSAVSTEAIKKAAGELVNGKIAVAAVGHTSLLPYAEELF
jgi:ubiquinol-cytochrome c reductase core subunit 2